MTNEDDIAHRYVDSRWGTRSRDERDRLASAYVAGAKAERKIATEAMHSASDPTSMEAGNG